MPSCVSVVAGAVQDTSTTRVRSHPYETSCNRETATMAKKRPQAKGKGKDDYVALCALGRFLRIV